MVSVTRLNRKNIIQLMGTNLARRPPQRGRSELVNLDKDPLEYYNPAQDPQHQ